MTKLSALAILTMAASLAAQSQLLTNGQIVGKPGDAPIGLGAGETIVGSTSAFDSPSIDRNGMILCRASLASGGTVTPNNNKVLLYGHTAADMQVMLRAGVLGAVSGFPNSIIQQLSSGTGLPLGANVFATQRLSPRGNYVLIPVQLYDGGNPGADGLVHATTASPNGATDTMLLWGTPSALLVLAQSNVTLMPGGAALKGPFSTLSQQPTALNSSGITIFKSDLAGGDVSGTTNDSAWVMGTPGTLTYMCREGDPINGGDLIILAGGLGNNAMLNEAGDVLHDEKFSQTLGNTPATPFTDQALLFRDHTTGLNVILAREGDTAPNHAGNPIPGVFLAPPAPSNGFTNSGKCGFHGVMTGAVTTADDGALFFGGLGSIKMVAREGETCPGTGGETFDVINGTTSASDAGVLFGSTLVHTGSMTNVNDSVLCVADWNGITLIAREGDPAPGLTGFVIGNVAGSSNFGSSSAHKMNERGQVFFTLAVNDGTTAPTAMYSWDPVHGLQLQLLNGDPMIGGTVSSISPPVQFSSGDGNCIGMNGNGDFVATANTTGVAGKVILRGHVGSMQTLPSTIDAVNGGSVSFSIDATASQAFHLYAIIGTSSGTAGGFFTPLGPQLIPLVPDFWTQLSIDLLNSPVYVNSLWFTDANGVNMAPASLNIPAGIPGLLGLTLHHAALLLDGNLAQTFVTEPSGVTLY